MNYLKHLDHKRIILASQSPRRQMLMKELGIPFKLLVKKGIDETYPAHLKRAEIPEFLAQHKSDAYNQEIEQGALVITADTIVWLKEKVIEKPMDREDAIRMINELSGSMHTVYTGVCIRSLSGKDVFSASTDVYFKNLEQSEIEFYVDNYSPYDKAGAYGIQEWIGYAAIEKIEGSYFNVMGLPIHMIYEHLKQLNINHPL